MRITASLAVIFWQNHNDFNTATRIGDPVAIIGSGKDGLPIILGTGQH
jgi:hypothetical protein